jgi:hypothetical protein
LAASKLMDRAFEIDGDHETLTFNGWSDDVGVSFTLLKKDYNQTLNLNFDIRYYAAYQGPGQNSGDYIFRPAIHTYDSLRYT